MEAHLGNNEIPYIKQNWKMTRCVYLETKIRKMIFPQKLLLQYHIETLFLFYLISKQKKDK